MKIIRETTNWDDCPHRVGNHDYLVSDNRLVAFRREGTDQWQKFTRPLNFNRGRRGFKTLKEEIPTSFVEPFMADPWENTSYNSLEVYFA